MMRASLRKALADYNLYLKKLGIDKIKKRKKKGTFVFEDCGNRTRYRCFPVARSRSSHTPENGN
jgi:hypothetical protein